MIERSRNQAARSGELGLEAARAQGLGGTNDYFRLAASVMAAHMGLGDYLHARIWAETLIKEAEENDQATGQAGLYWNSALLAELEGRLDEALRLCERALARMGEQDNLREYARLRSATAQIMLSIDQPDVARVESLLTTCLPDLRDHGSHLDLGIWNHLFSAVLLLRGDASGAEGRARQALDLLGGASADVRADAWTSLTDALVANGREAEAIESLDQAVRQASEFTSGREAALLWRELAERLSEFGDGTGASAAFRQALDAVSVRDRSRAVRAAAQNLHRSLALQRQQHQSR